jgi:two-component system, OmpR family, response regulator ChvI
MMRLFWGRMPTIGLVESDRDTLTSVSSALENEGHRVVPYTDGQSALGGFRTTRPHLAIVESRASGIDGLEVLRRLRQTSFIPVMLLAATADETDEIIGLRMGADDVIHRPFSHRVLVQRVETLLRREVGDTKLEDQTVIECGHLRIDMARHMCTWKDQSVALTRTQISVLQTMVRRPGIVMSRDTLLRA